MKNFLKQALTSFLLGAIFIAGGVVFAAVTIPGTCTTPGNCNELQTALKSLVLKTTLKFSDADGSNTLGLKAPITVSSNVTWTLPANDGTANQVLATDGAGNLIWKTNPNAKRIGEFVFRKSNYYASDAAAIADGYLPVKAGTITNGKNLYPLWSAKNTEFISGNDIVFPSNVNGMFLRNNGGNATTEGTFQADATAVNGLQLKANSSRDSNSVYVDQMNSAGTFYNGGSTWSNDSTPTSVNYPLNGDTETRPDNRAYQLYTIIDTY